MYELTEKLKIRALEELANIFKATSHPMRIAIIDLLDGNRKMNVKEIYEDLGLEQTSTSRHLRILKDKGIVNCTRQGKNVYYYLKNRDVGQAIKGIKTG